MWESRVVEAIMTTGTAVPPALLGEMGEVMIDPPPTDETVREVAELLGDTRPGMLVSGFTVAAVTVGVAVVAAVLPMRLNAGASTLLSLALLFIVMASVIRTVVLMISAGRPLLDELGELRRETGAPVDPTVPWTPMRMRTATSEAPDWDRVRALIAAVYFRNSRINLALTWATLAIISFLTWTFVTLMITGRI